MPLSDVAIRKLLPRERAYLVRDDRGLYLEVVPGGGKYWRLRVRIDGKEVKRSLGVYPAVSLKEARAKRDSIHLALAHGENPFHSARGEKFATVAREWHEKKCLPIRTPKYSTTVLSRLERLIFPYIGHRPIGEITPPELLDVLRIIEGHGHHETAHRMLQICGQIWRYGIATGRATRDVSADLRGALMPWTATHHPTITDHGQIGALMRAIDGMENSPIVRGALLLMAYTFVRPGELRKAEWDEIDMGRKEWRISADKMKMRRLHIVPLSPQALAVLEEVGAITRVCRWVFPAVRTFDRPMSDATCNAALRRLGYEKEDFTGHGFRSMFSTVANESGLWSPDAIERQLAHVEGNSVRAAYNYAQYLEERTRMMAWWGAWLEEKKGK